MKVWLYARLSCDEDSEQNSLTNQQNILLIGKRKISILLSESLLMIMSAACTLTEMVLSRSLQRSKTKN